MTPETEREIVRRLTQIDHSLRVLSALAIGVGTIWVMNLISAEVGAKWGGLAEGVAAFAVVIAFAMYINRLTRD